jgi:clathrin heavy chain
MTLCKLVLGQNKHQFVEKWVKEDKLTWTLELGNLLKQYNNLQLAARVYKKAGCHQQVV